MPVKSIISTAPISTEVMRERQPQLLRILQELVEVESPSDNKAAVDRCVDRVAAMAESLGGRVRRHRQREFGDLLELRFGRASRALKPVLLLGHLDTVWPLGTLAKMPFRIDADTDGDASVGKGRVWGPGVLDMKAGVAMAIIAIECLRGSRPIVLLLVSDEEVGSPASRSLTEKLAQQCEAVYVLEPAQGVEPAAYKTARKGIGNYRIHVTGVAAHSGVDFEKGHSAIAELAHQIGVIQGFTDVQHGITVNVGTVQGGTRSNVIAAEAWAEVDVRIARKSDVAKLDRRFRNLRVRDKHCVLAVAGGLNRPPMERTPGTVKLFRRAATLARGLGFPLQEAATGGGSDGNFTSALGVPTLDGMGAVGEGAHAPHESILLKDLAPRTALLTAMLMKPEG